MRVTGLGDVHLTYCTNIHAGETWREICESLDAHVPEIKQRVSPDDRIGIGLRLSGVAAAEARRPELLDAFRDRLEGLGAYVFTVNAFPYGPFHGASVKERVYSPDWRSEARVGFTKDAAALLADVLPDGLDGSISTVPGCFRTNAREQGAVAQIAHNLLRAAADLAAVERRTGKRISLALEPEPWCLLETADDCIDFFHSHLLARETVTAFGAMTRTGDSEAERLLRRHLGVCYDACHASVEYESPVTGLRRLTSGGIEIPKIQLSAAMRVPEMRRDLKPALAAYNDGVYLHQTVVRRDGRKQSFVDLPHALAALDEAQVDGEWRIHCHVPLFLRDLGEVESTQPDLIELLGVLREEPMSQHLEVETYTWDVLPEALRSASKSADIAREMSFCLRELTR